MNPVLKILGDDSKDRQLKPLVIGKEGTTSARAACPKCHAILKHSYSGPHHQYFCDRCGYEYNYETYKLKK